MDVLFSFSEDSCYICIHYEPHDIEVVVAWFDGSKRREIRLDSVVEEYIQ